MRREARFLRKQGTSTVPGWRASLGRWECRLEQEKGKLFSTTRKYKTGICLASSPGKEAAAVLLREFHMCPCIWRAG